MAPWTRTPLAALAAGYDAVIELAETALQTPKHALVGQISAQKAIPSQVKSSRAATGSSYTPPSASFSAPQAGVDLVFQSGSATVQGPGVKLTLMVKNASGQAAVVVAQPTLGSITHMPGSASSIGAGQIQPVEAVLPNVPGGSHTVSVRIFDLAGGLQDTAVQGQLQVTKAARSLSLLGAAFPGALQVTASGWVNVSAVPGPFAPRIAAAGNLIQLRATVALDIKVDLSERGTVQSITPVAYNLQTGTPSYERELWTDFDRDERQATGEMTVSAPLISAVDSTTQAVSLRADLWRASVSFASADSAAMEVADELKTKAEQQIKAIGSVQVGPVLSLVGALPQGESVQELSVQRVDLTALASTSTNKACIAAGLVLPGSGSSGGALVNFVGTDDFAVVISGRVIKALVEFRWRTGGYPKERLVDPGKDAYSEAGTTVPVLIYTKAVQKDIIDPQGATIAEIRQLGTYVTKTYTEDHLRLGGHVDFVFLNVVRADGGTVPQGQRDLYKQAVEQQKNLVMEYPFYMTSLTPTASASQNYENWLQAIRAGITGHLSRPFATPQMVTLTGRTPNGIENLLLSRGKL